MQTNFTTFLLALFLPNISFQKMSLEKAYSLPDNIIEIIDTLESQKETYEDQLAKGKISFAIFFTDSKFEFKKDDNFDKDYKIFFSHDRNLAERLKVSYPGMIAFNRDENVVYRLKYSDPVKMINIVKTPVLGEINSTNFRFYEESGLPIFYLVYDENKGGNDNIQDDKNSKKAKKHEKAAFDDYYQIAFSLKDILKIAYFPFKETNSLKSFNIKKEELPAIISFHDKKKFRLTTLTPTKMVNFLKDFLENKIEPFILSQEEPLTNNGPVFTLTYENYKKFVDDTVFVFHAPYCGFCVRLKPVIEKLALVLKGKLKVGMVDMTLNDMPDYDIKGFPTIMFRKKEYKASDRVKGDRSLEDLVQWLRLESGIDIEIKKEMNGSKEESKDRVGEFSKDDELNQKGDEKDKMKVTEEIKQIKGNQDKKTNQNEEVKRSVKEEIGGKQKEEL